ncbi:MAG: AAA family ATPase [Sandaracinaceae bacterium]|nr:AAA family ATPase [Sandaracinaceae bacterium]
MRLDRIEVEGFKSIGSMGLELSAINLLVGANGAGKSNFVGALSLLGELVEGRLQLAVARAGGASSLLHHGPKRTPAMRIEVRSGANRYMARLAYAPQDKLFFEDERAWGQGVRYSAPFEVPMGSGHDETRLQAEARAHPGGVCAWVLARVRQWRLYHFHDTSPMAPVKQKGRIDDNALLRPDAGNLAAFLYRLREASDGAGAYQRVVASIRQVAPFFDDFVLRPDPVRPDLIQLEWTERGSDAYFNAHSFSDGTLRYVCLATLLLQPSPPSLVLIDEPEIGLHPFAITQLAAMLESAATRTQLLVATQSVTLMNQFSPDVVIVVDRRDGQSTFQRLQAAEIASWTDEYSLGELWEKNVLGGRPQRG